MKGIITALRPEATPFISHLRLKRDMSVRSHELYVNDQFALIITGQGSISASIGATVLLQHFPQKLNALCSIGIAGATEDFTIGECIAIHKVTHQTTQNSYYPEMLIPTGLREASLHSVDTPLDHSSASLPPNTLVDMESAGTFEAVKHFIPLEQLLIMKVVSDYLTPETINKEMITKLIEPQVYLVVTALEKLAIFITSQKQSIFTDSEQTFLDDLLRSLHFTQSQQQILTSTICREQVLAQQSMESLRNTLQNLPIVKLSLQSPPQTKQERTKVFNELLNAITLS